MKLVKSKKALSPVVAAIIVIAVTVVVSLAVAAWMGALTFPFMKTQTYPDIYDPRNSTVQTAYDNCLKELQRLNYTVYDATFSKEVWVRTENFTEFLERAKEQNITIIFMSPPHYIWFNIKLPTDETLTTYYKLEDEE